MQYKLVVNTDAKKGTISRYIYGHFAEHLGRCIYEGFWVGEDSPIPNTNGIRNDIVEALKKLNIPVLRWPGGCFADEYHWKNGVGPRSERKTMLNTHWGGVVETNHFGTHEFMELCEMLGCEPYISGNVGSGSVQEMQEWIEYMTLEKGTPMSEWRIKNGRKEPWKLKFFGIGNESWGCGGFMRPEYYVDLYRHYQTYVRNYGDNRIFKIACGANSTDYRWTEVLMREAGSLMDGLSLHYYTVPGTWNKKGSAVDFTEEEWFTTLKKALFMDELIQRHVAIMDQYDPEKRVALVVDEWGTWYDVEPGTNPGFLYQQNTIRDALVAGATLNIFNHHCDRVRMANIAQTVNVLQAMALTDQEKLVLTPTYHVFAMYKVHQEASLLDTHATGDEYVMGEEKIEVVSASASEDADGKVHVSLCNFHHAEPVRVTIELRGWESDKGEAEATILAGTKMNDRNTFENPNQVEPQPFTNFTLSKGKIEADLPPMSVSLFSIAR